MAAKHRWAMCEICGPTVLCGDCGNNVCNGSTGKLPNGKPCGCDTAFAQWQHGKASMTDRQLKLLCSPVAEPLHDRYRAWRKDG